VRDAADAADRLIGMVNTLLSISRLEDGRLELSAQPTDLVELTREVLDDLKPLIADKDLGLSTHAAAVIPPALVEQQLFRQVIVNLISNAVKYTPAGGAIRIDIESSAGALCWRISDTGIGVPRAAQRRLFQKFFRADNVTAVDTEGTGLGLYLVRLIVELSGGRISCESEEGIGSTFAVTLPQQGARS
jgi:signal transduction histidine kinase